MRHCGAIALTHPDQRRILAESGIRLAGKRVLDRPIGALEAFDLRQELPKRFTVGWVGRPVRHFGQELKRVDRVIEALRALDGELESWAAANLDLALELAHARAA